MPDPEIAAHPGEVLWKMGREAEARELWARSLEANPDSDIIHAPSFYPVNAAHDTGAAAHRLCWVR